MTMRTRARTAVSAVVALGAFCAAREASAVPCNTLPHPVYVTGSSAVQPLMAAVAATLAAANPPITIIYQKGGSCVGVNAAVKGSTIAGTGTYWAGADAGVPIASTCDLPAADAGVGQAVDIGASDVFAVSCPAITTADVTAASVGDFWGPNQIMTFVAPKTATQVKNISAEAAYLTMGKSLTGKVVSPWTDGNALAIRNASSGTQTMIGKAIHLDAASWFGVDKGSSQNVEAALKTANDTSATPQTTLGIVSTGEADNDRAYMKVLAFQPLGAKCAFWPDSSLTSFDKANVITGVYPIFGPLHLLTKVDTNNVPVNADAATIISYFAGTADPPGGPTQLIDLEIANHTVPQCAMKVKRTSEMGDLAPFTSAKPCGCYFAAKVPGGAAPASCKACTPTGNECTAATQICSYGYCEAK